MKNSISWQIPLETISEANTSEHWTKKHKRHKHQKSVIAWQFMTEKPDISLPCKVRLTRISPRSLDDDNLRMAFKWIRDAIADNLIPGKAAGRADDDKRIFWEYAQEKGPKGIKVDLL